MHLFIFSNQHREPLQGWVSKSSLGRGQETSADKSSKSDVHIVVQREWKSRDAMRLLEREREQDLRLCYMEQGLDLLTKYPLLLVSGIEC